MKLSVSSFIIFMYVDTLNIGDDIGEASVHLTVGIDTLIWDLTFASFRKFCLRLSGIEDKLVSTKIKDDALFWNLQVLVLK